jgi:haloalkane dehalogenase
MSASTLPLAPSVDVSTIVEPRPAPSAFPFESRYADVLGSRMHYVDVGEGDPIVFLHGNPTSSYLWRNIIPHLQGQGRCIAPDLIGMGKSDKPDLDYTYDDHYRYLCAFIDGLELDRPVTLVIHDWGSALGFRWAMDHADRVKGIAFMEATIRPLSMDQLTPSLKVGMRMFRAPYIGGFLISVLNIFLRVMLSDLTDAKMSPEALAYYRSAYPTIASRKAVRVWPQEVPFDGAPANNLAVFEAYGCYLASTDIPKLMFFVNDGVAIQEPELAWAKENLSNLEVVDLGEGRHFIQETHPVRIGTEISRWFARS